MNFDWRARLILAKIAEGYTYGRAAEAAGVSRQTILDWRNVSEEFAEAVANARKAGEAERRYYRWLHHPFRGMRPPTGKGHGGKPRFIYGRR